MSDKQVSNESGKEQKQRKRRPRTQSNERNFICSCGKSYLSYPALYTHIKNKHDGKAPGMVQMPKIEKGNKLKKYNFKVDDQDEENEEGEKPSEHYLEQFTKFFNCFEPYSQPYDLKGVIEKLPPETSFSFISAIKEWEEGKVEEVLLENGALNTNIERVFGKFILQLSSKVDKGVLAEVLIILHIWRKSYKNYNSEGCSEKEGKNSSENCLNILEIVNTLMESSFKESIPQYSSILEEHYMLDPAKPKLMDKCICKFIYLFSKWLFAEKYVNTVLGINKEADVGEDQEE